MKLERIKRRSGGTLVLEITPLIDVVFLLLIFFMLATSFVSVVSEKLNNSENKDVIISADKDIDYGFIVEIMSLLKESGASAINIDTAIKSR